MKTEKLLLPIALAASLGLLWAAKPVMVPLLIALLTSLLLSPFVEWLERRVPALLATFGAILIAMLVLVGTVVLVGSQATAFESKVPELLSNASEHFQRALAEFGPRLGLARGTAPALLQKGLESSAGTGGSAALTALSFTLSTVTESALILIMTFLMLYYRRHASRQLKRLEKRDGTVGPTQELIKMGQNYLAGLGLVMVVIGVADTICLLLAGAPFAAVFGFLGGLSVLIPYVGIMVLAPVSAATTWLLSGSSQLALEVLAIFSVIHFLEGNLISPYFVGGKINLNPLVTIIAVLVGGNLWGPAGMVLFVPLFGMLKMALDHTPRAEAIAALLGPVSPEDLKVLRKKVEIPKAKRRKRVITIVPNPKRT